MNGREGRRVNTAPNFYPILKGTRPMNENLVNLSLFRGDRELIAPGDLLREIHSAFEQRRLGLATISADPPDTDAKPTDLATFPFCGGLG